MKKLFCIIAISLSLANANAQNADSSKLTRVRNHMHNYLTGDSAKQNRRRAFQSRLDSLKGGNIPNLSGIHWPGRRRNDPPAQQPGSPQPATPTVASRPTVSQPATPQPVTTQPAYPQPATPQSTTPQPVSPQPVAPQPAPQLSNSFTQSFNGISVTLTSCVGYAASQSVLVTFLVSSPSDKTNQTVTVGVSYGWHQLTPAIDAQGNQLGLTEVQFGNQSNRYGVTTQLYTASSLKGAFSLNNALPSSSAINVLNIPISLKNLEGQSNVTKGVLTFRNVAITWQ